MSIREELANVIARDPRYTDRGLRVRARVAEPGAESQAEGHVQARALRARARPRKKRPAEARPEIAGHVTGRELCLSHAGWRSASSASMAVIVLDQWGLRRPRTSARSSTT